MAEPALVAHIVSQTKSNVTFMLAHNYISQADATAIISRLDAIDTRSVATNHQATVAAAAGALPDLTRTLSVSSPAAVSTPPSAGPARRDIAPPPPRVQKAKALWGYNEDGREPNDLSFSPGDIVEIVDETNADWWTGKCKGRQGLFPSNHVEKFDAPGASPATPPTSSYSTPPAWGPPGPSGMPMPSSPSYGYGNEKDYPYGGPPNGGPYGGPHGGPSRGPYDRSYSGPPPPGEPASEEHKDKDKKKKFGGKLGGTMAHAAAGGVGFGAGAAIGSGIIGAIF